MSRKWLSTFATKNFSKSKEINLGPLSLARSGNRASRFPPVTSVARAVGERGHAQRLELPSVLGPAYQRTSWPRPARWAATPVSGLKCPSAGMDANRILMA